jgi:hypothetical protein
VQRGGVLRECTPVPEQPLQPFEIGTEILWLHVHMLDSELPSQKRPSNYFSTQRKETEAQRQGRFTVVAKHNLCLLS